MAVHHSLEVADGSLDDDGRLRRTGQALFELFMCYACIVPSCAFEFGAHLGVLSIENESEVAPLTQEPYGVALLISSPRSLDPESCLWLGVRRSWGG